MPEGSDLPSCLIEALNHSADSLNTQLNRGLWLSPTIGPGMTASNAVIALCRLTKEINSRAKWKQACAQSPEGSLVGLVAREGG
jgi:hypothetical protein